MTRTEMAQLREQEEQQAQREREVAITFKAREWQKPLIKFFRDDGKRASVVAHRRAGKDRAAMFIELEQMLRSPREVWHTLPSYKQARKVIWDALTGDGKRLIDIAFPAAIVKKRHEDEMKVELVNGSLWRCVGADNFDSLVGANPKHVTFSEWALTAPKSYEFVRPILAENDGTALFLTTPRGFNHAHSMHEAAREMSAWYCATHPVSQTKLINEAVLAEERRTMPDELYRQEYECDFSAANVGSILGKYIEAAEREGRIKAGPLFDPFGAEIHLVSDIGYRDAAAWWWVQPCPGGYRMLDHDEDSGLDAESWIERLKARGWTVGTLWLPHDARAKTFRSHLTVVDMFLKSGLAARYRVTPHTTIADRINAARIFARKTEFDRASCARGLISLREWQFKWDEERHAFSAEPNHNEHSHTGDAFSYCGVALKEDVPTPIVAELEPQIGPPHYAFSLEMLHDARRDGLL
jgi:hypothetical protein